MRLQGMLFAALVAIQLSASAQEPDPPAYRPIKGLKVADGQQMPDFLAPRSLASYRGKPVLVNFYSQYCPPCIREIPKLNALQHLNPDLQVLAITPDSPVEALEYAKERNLAWPIAAPGEEYLFKTLGVDTFPTFAIIDADGRLVSATYGNQLGGEDGQATLDGISSWVEHALQIKLN